ncbi:MAG: hypothetical protein KJP00_05555 [Bacteroidia bacterium]|nr:hypothetical protein [Bacteroidia bacterium]
MKLRNFLLFLVAAFVIGACSTDSSSKSEKEETEVTTNDDEPKNFQEALNKAGKELDELFSEDNGEENIEEIEVVNFRELKDMLPSRIGSLKQEGSEGQTTGMLGFKISNAEATYSDGESNMDINIVDVGKAGKLVNMIASWSTFEVDKEDQDGYEKTTTYEGFKAYEQYDSRRESGSFAVIIKERFIVTVNGDNIRMRDLKKAIDQVNLRKLSRMAA